MLDLLQWFAAVRAEFTSGSDVFSAGWASLFG